MVRQLATVAVLGALVFPTQARAQAIEPGAIAVMPFGSAVRAPQAWQSAMAISGVVDEALTESGRFLAVLPRNSAVEAGIQQLLEAAQGPANFESYVQISTEAGLNANYLLDGYIERHDVRPERRDGGNVYVAEMDVRVKIYDVETGRLILNENLSVTSGLLDQVGPQVESDCPGGFRGAACRAKQEVQRRAASEAERLSTDRLAPAQTAEAALERAHNNASTAVASFIQEKMSLLLVDYGEGDGGIVNELVLLSAPDIEQGTELTVSVRSENRLGGGFRDRTLGSAVVEQIDGEYAYARITDGGERVDEAIKARDVVVVTKGGE